MGSLGRDRRAGLCFFDQRIHVGLALVLRGAPLATAKPLGRVVDERIDYRRREQGERKREGLSAEHDGARRAVLALTDPLVCFLRRESMTA